MVVPANGLQGTRQCSEANCFEAFPLYAVGVLLALLSKVDIDQIQMWTGIFVVARVAYVACYLTDKINRARWRGSWA
jgi:uncharacterized MAPEG superfamily protein